MAIIDEIKEAEKKAQKIKDDAKAAARADSELIETEARNKAAELKKEAREKADALIKAAETEAGAARVKRKEESDAECEHIKAEGRQNVDRAAESIFERAIRL